MKTSLFLALFASLGFAACATPDHFGPNEKRLGENLKRIESGELVSASRDLEAMLTQTEPLADELKVQRFYAAVLLTNTHVLASLGSPFIRDISHNAGGAIGGASSDSGSATAHVVATALYANLGKELAAKTKGASLREKGVELLPEGLRDLPLSAAESSLDLAILSMYSRLGFEDRVAKTLDASPAMHQIEACEKLLDECKVAPGERPWIYWTIYDYLRTRDEPAAFKFGVRLLETADASGGTIGRHRTDAVVAWIRDGSKFVFRCPSCNQPIVPELRACQNDQTAHISFYAEPKKP